MMVKLAVMAWEEWEYKFQEELEFEDSIQQLSCLVMLAWIGWLEDLS